MSKISERICSVEYRVIAAIGAGLFIITPVIMAILAIIFRNIDYTVQTYPLMIRKVIFPASSFLFFIAILVYIFQMICQKKKFIDVIKENPVIIFFFAVVLWMLISQIYNGFGYAISGAHVRLREETYTMQLRYFLLFLPGAALIKSKEYKSYLIRTHICVSILLAITTFVLYYTQQPSTLYASWTPQYYSIYTNTNYYGYYLAISVPLCAASFVGEEKIPFKILGMVGLVANTVTLSFNNTMGAWVACSAAMIAIFIGYTMINRRVSVLSIIATVVFGICLYLPGHFLGSFETNTSELAGDLLKIINNSEDVNRAGSGRWAIWKKSIDLILKSPVFGIGFEGIAYRKYFEYVGNYRPHNEFLQYAVFYGIPTTIMYFCGSFGIVLRGIKKHAILDKPTFICLMGAFGYLISSFFGLTVYCTAPFLFLFLGMGYAGQKTINAQK